MQRFLFFWSNEPDVDHLAPMAWKCLEEGDAVDVVLSRPFPLADSRLEFLRRYPGFQVLPVPRFRSRRYSLAVAGQLLWPRRRVRSLLRQTRVAACFFGWGKGLAPRGRGVRNALNRTLRTAFIGATLDLGLPAFALPHGVVLVPPVDPRPDGGPPVIPPSLSRADRNCFTVYVTNTEQSREWFVRYHDQDPAVVQNWGSLRFSPEWRRVLMDIAAPVTLPATPPGAPRVLFFLPKWQPYIDQPSTVQLLRELAARDDVQLVVKTHPRLESRQLAGSLGEYLAGRPNVVLAGDAGSARLIEAADVVVWAHSSIVLEVLLQGKPLVHAAYLNRTRPSAYRYPGSLVAHGASDVHAFVGRLARGGPPPAEAAGAEFSRDIVYGGREPFDVPAYYYARVREHLARPPAVPAAR